MPSDSQRLLVFEGFFDFLAFQTQLGHKPAASTNCLVLNSLSFFEKSKSLMDSYAQIHLYLDRDDSGRHCTSKALSWNANYQDESHLYKDFKDLSEWQEAQVTKNKKRRGFRL